MRRKPLAELAGVEEVRQHLERWRETRTTRDLPEELWGSAVELAKAHGASAIARALRLHYGRLKHRAEAAVEREGASPKSPHPLFVEFDMSPSASPAECIIELEDQARAKMTIRLRGATDIDVVGLTEAFWRRER